MTKISGIHGRSRVFLTQHQDGHGCVAVAFDGVEEPVKSSTLVNQLGLEDRCHADKQAQQGTDLCSWARLRSDELCEGAEEQRRPADRLRRVQME